MNNEQGVKRDEQVIAVENASFRWALYFIAFGLLTDALYRKEIRNEPIWDLIALVGVGAAISVLYLIRHRAMVSPWPWRWGKTVMVFAVCMVVGVLISIFPILAERF